jgi:hypothetical protein
MPSVAKRCVRVCAVAAALGLMLAAQPEAAQARSCPDRGGFYGMRAHGISCAKARRVVRRIFSTPCQFYDVCRAAGFTFRLGQSGERSRARRGKQAISWFTDYSNGRAARLAASAAPSSVRIDA